MSVEDILRTKTLRGDSTSPYIPNPATSRDDVEQEIVITLKRVTDQRREVAKNYLWGTARNVVRLYWRKRYRQAKRVCHLSESDRGEMVAGEWRYVSIDDDSDARLDALASLLPYPGGWWRYGIRG